MSSTFDNTHGSHYYFWNYIQENNFEIKAKNFLEIGSTRQVDYKNDRYWDLFDSSGFFFKRSKEDMFTFITVDMDENNIKMLKGRFSGINANVSDGETFTKNYDGIIDLLYMDAFDYEKPEHPESRRDRYKDVLNTEITNEACWEMHMTCAKNILPNLSDDVLICFDDVFDINTFEGKGKTAIPFFLNNGFEIAYYRSTPGTLILKRRD
jgi:hypothetical protein